MFQQKKLDISTIIGIIFAIIMIFFSVSINGSLRSFFDLGSVLIVFLGTIAITIACFSLEDVINVVDIIANTVLWKYEKLNITAAKALRLAEFARENTVNKLEQHAIKNNYDPLIIRGIMMIVDGEKTDQIENILTQEVTANINHQMKAISIIRKSAEIAPAMGLIGTLIGLVQMLASLDDVSKIGPSMALALLTTFYGTLISYVILFPLATKIEKMAREYGTIFQIYLYSIISISQNENPRHLQVTINSLLLPENQIKML